MRSHVKMALVLGSAFVLVLGTACSSENPAPAPRTDDPDTTSTTPTDAPSVTESPIAETTEVELWFATDNGLFVVRREVGKEEGIGAAAVASLLDGPQDRESAAGVTSTIPEGTELLSLNVSAGLATVDLSSEFESGGGSLSMQTRIAQVVYTLTQFPTVDRVEFRLDGEPVEAIGGEGVLVDKPQRRKDLRDLLPPILVEMPAIGDEVQGPFEVAGTANVFEATVSIRVVDDQGNVLVETFTTATCGTGCRGRYGEEIDFDVADRTVATLEVFESSAEDGRPLHVVEIPLILLP